MDMVETDLKESIAYASQGMSPQFILNQSGVKMAPLQSKNKGFAGLTSGVNTDFSKMDQEHFIHSLKREDPTDFKLAELDEVESIIIEDKPRAPETKTMDDELVQFFGFVTKKLDANTKGLKTVQ
jgi:hypothetical protein